MFKDHQYAEQVFRWIKTGTLIIAAVYLIACYRIIRQAYPPSPIKNLAIPSLSVNTQPEAT